MQCIQVVDQLFFLFDVCGLFWVQCWVFVGYEVEVVEGISIGQYCFDIGFGVEEVYVVMIIGLVFWQVFVVDGVGEYGFLFQVFQLIDEVQVVFEQVDL